MHALPVDDVIDFDIKIPKKQHQKKKKKKKGKGEKKDKEEKTNRGHIELKEIVPEEFEEESRWPLGETIPYEIGRSLRK